ncbi:MAG: PaaI family thioesterase, partial [Dehalococcoidia bacterium]
MAAVNREMGLGERRELARYCFGCGRRNPYGLRLAFRLVGRRVETEFTPRPEHQGFPGVAHGGITATLLDEAMGWAAYALGILAFTARMETRFRQPLLIDKPVSVTGELVKERGRLLQARAEIRTRQG